MGRQTELHGFWRLSSVAAGWLSATLVASLAPPLVAAPSAPVVQAIGCIIEPAQVALLGSPVIGILESIHVERGDLVQQGQLLASLNSEVERAGLRVAEKRSRVDADVLASEANVALAEQRLSRANELEGTNYISQQAIDQLLAENEVAVQRLAQARDQQRIWHEELQVARAQLELRRLRSPFAGMVVERFAEPGERIEEKPIIKVAQVDPLRVELMVPTSAYGRYRPGDEVIVRPELPDAGPAVASVTRVDNIIDAASNTFRVRLDLPNPDNRLPAGLRCRVDPPPAPIAAKVAAKVADTGARPR